jgi:hypothetical protein
MSRTRVSTNDGVPEPRLGASGAWGDSGLLQAAFEGRLDRRGRSLAARARLPTPDLAPPGGAGRATIPLHVSGGADYPSAWLVESRSASEPGDSALTSGLMRALGFLAVVLGVLLLLDFLNS